MRQCDFLSNITIPYTRREDKYSLETSSTPTIIRPITWRDSDMKPALEAPESSLKLVLPSGALPHNVRDHIISDTATIRAKSGHLTELEHVRPLAIAPHGQK